MHNTLRTIAFAMALAAAPAAAQNEREWDGLVRVESANFDAVYLAPGADFSPYDKVMLDATQVSFRRNWLRDHNTAQPEMSDRISEQDAREMLQAVQTGFQDVFAAEYAAAGQRVVSAPGPDVLRVRTAIVNLDIETPDRSAPSSARTYSREPSEATLVIEVRDSMSGAILGRAVDRREIGDTAFLMRRSSATNRADFERLFRQWAQLSAEALARLKATPVPAAG